MVIIGGSGQGGTFLGPRLVAAGYDVLVVTPGQRSRTSPMPRGTQCSRSCWIALRAAAPLVSRFVTCSPMFDRPNLFYAPQRSPPRRGAAWGGAALPLLWHHLGPRC
jgi:choline dehydrogenase-like flavoprotein